MSQARLHWYITQIDQEEWNGNHLNKYCGGCLLEIVWSRKVYEIIFRKVEKRLSNISSPWDWLLLKRQHGKTQILIILTIFLKQLQGEKTRGDIYLYSRFVNKQEKVWDVDAGNNSGNNGSEMIEFIILRETQNLSSSVMIPNSSELVFISSEICLASSH